jgi:hypothetical protein
MRRSWEFSAGRLPSQCRRDRKPHHLDQLRRAERSAERGAERRAGQHVEPLRCAKRQDSSVAPRKLRRIALEISPSSPAASHVSDTQRLRRFICVGPSERNLSVRPNGRSNEPMDGNGTGELARRARRRASDRRVELPDAARGMRRERFGRARTLACGAASTPPRRYRRRDSHRCCRYTSRGCRTNATA